MCNTLRSLGFSTSSHLTIFEQPPNFEFFNSLISAVHDSDVRITGGTMFDIAISKKMLDRRGGQFTLNTQIRTENKSVVLFGPSGSGKSLTLQAIAGLIVPEHGHIRIGETTLFDTADRKSVV